MHTLLSNLRYSLRLDLKLKANMGRMAALVYYPIEHYSNSQYLYSREYHICNKLAP